MYYKINTLVPTVGVQATCSHALHWKRCHDKPGGCSWLHALRVSCTLDQSDGLCLRDVFAFFATFLMDAESPIRPAARATSACCFGARVCVCVCVCEMCCGGQPHACILAHELCIHCARTCFAAFLRERDFFAGKRVKSALSPLARVSAVMSVVPYVCSKAAPMPTSNLRAAERVLSCMFLSFSKRGSSSL